MTGNAMRLQPNSAPPPDRSLITQPQYNEMNPKVDLQAEDNEAEGEVCFICASPVIHTAVAPCNHQTCHICSLRMRALYKNKACAHCRVSLFHKVRDWMLTENAERIRLCDSDRLGQEL